MSKVLTFTRKPKNGESRQLEKIKGKLRKKKHNLGQRKARELMLAPMSPETIREIGIEGVPALAASCPDLEMPVESLDGYREDASKGPANTLAKRPAEEAIVMKLESIEDLAVDLTNYTELKRSNAAKALTLIILDKKHKISNHETRVLALAQLIAAKDESDNAKEALDKLGIGHDTIELSSLSFELTSTEEEFIRQIDNSPNHNTKTWYNVLGGGLFGLAIGTMIGFPDATAIEAVVALMSGGTGLGVMAGTIKSLVQKYSAWLRLPSKTLRTLEDMIAGIDENIGTQKILDPIKIQK